MKALAALADDRSTHRTSSPSGEPASSSCPSRPRLAPHEELRLTSGASISTVRQSAASRNEYSPLPTRNVAVLPTFRISTAMIERCLPVAKLGPGCATSLYERRSTVIIEHAVCPSCRGHLGVTDGSVLSSVVSRLPPPDHGSIRPRRRLGRAGGRPPFKRCVLRHSARNRPLCSPLGASEPMQRVSGGHSPYMTLSFPPGRLACLTGSQPCADPSADARDPYPPATGARLPPSSTSKRASAGHQGRVA